MPCVVPSPSGVLQVSAIGTPRSFLYYYDLEHASRERYLMSFQKLKGLLDEVAIQVDI